MQVLAISPAGGGHLHANEDLQRDAHTDVHEYHALALDAGHGQSSAYHTH